MLIKIVSRRSDLARLQAYEVGHALQNVAPHVEVEYIFKASAGDLNLDIPLTAFGQKGAFTQDISEDLRSGHYDLAVHSWKDLPIEISPDTEIVATLPREDVRDVLLVNKHFLFAKEKFVRLLSSSPRRQYNLQTLLPRIWPRESCEFQFFSVRGNILTRLKKLRAGEGDGLVVAKAALDRLLTTTEADLLAARAEVRAALQDCRWMVLPIAENPTAAAQGALAIEIARGREDLRELLNKINHRDTFQTVMREREILASYGGGCHQKIGVNVLLRPYGELLALRGLTDQGEVLNRWQITSSPKALAKAEARPFPEQMADSRWFERRELPAEVWRSALLMAKAWWVARESALPQSLVPLDKIIWVAGLKTWQTLARRGWWVNGCAEGLGDLEETRVETLVGEEIPWLKLTHVDSAQKQKEAIGTYQLVPVLRPPDLRGKTHFFWASASSLKQAYELFPQEVSQGVHACGPGQTAREIAQILGQEPQIFLSYEQWQATFLPRP